jgi:hypothetical protein
MGLKYGCQVMEKVVKTRYGVHCAELCILGATWEMDGTESPR